MSFNAMMSEHRSLDVGCHFNVMPLIDHATGIWVKGTRGENILVGGFVHHTGIIAPANCGKSALGLYMWAAVGNRYKCTTGHVYETEGTMPVSRITNTSLEIKSGTPFIMEDMADDEEPRFMMIDGTSLKLDQWADAMNDTMVGRNKLRGTKKHEVTLPYVLNKTRKDKIIRPMIAFIDSATEAEATSVGKLIDLGVDDSKGQTSYMRDGLVKTKVYGNSMISLCTKGDIFVISTGSLDSFVDMGGMPGKAPEKTMGHLTNNKKMKGLGTSYKKRTSNIWQFGQPKPLYKGTAAADKKPRYPRDTDDYYVGNTDLEQVTIQNLRGKSGGSGSAFTLVRSQREGIKTSLTEFEFCRLWGDPKVRDYGIIAGKGYNYSLALMPDLSLGNTTLNAAFESSHQLRRAMELIFGMKFEFYAKQDRQCLKYRCTPEELYADIKEMGYNWEILLSTRGFWQFIEEEDPALPFLSILDLLKMRAQEYHPSWYDATGINNAAAK